MPVPKIPRCKNSPAAFATQSVIAGKYDDTVVANETIGNQFRQQSPEIIDLPRFSEKKR